MLLIISEKNLNLLSEVFVYYYDGTFLTYLSWDVKILRAQSKY